MLTREMKRLLGEPAAWGRLVNGEGIYFIAEKAARIHSEKCGGELVPVDGYWLVKNRKHTGLTGFGMNELLTIF